MKMMLPGFPCLSLLFSLPRRHRGEKMELRRLLFALFARLRTTHLGSIFFHVSRNAGTTTEKVDPSHVRGRRLSPVEFIAIVDDMVATARRCCRQTRTMIDDRPAVPPRQIPTCTSCPPLRVMAYGLINGIASRHCRKHNACCLR